jgi:choice-of-anchor C domain-containing protein
MSTTLFRAVLALIVAGWAGTASAAAFQNGSFESASVNPGGGFTTLPLGSTAIDGWTVTDSNVDYIGTFWQAADGVRSIDLTGTVSGAIAQTFDTIAGLTYVVEFAMAGNPDGGPDIKSLQVSADGQSADFDFDSGPTSRAAMGYVQHSFTFIADGTSATLIFANTTPGTFFGAVIDDVSVAVPEPAGLAALGASLAMLLLRRRR